MTGNIEQEGPGIRISDKWLGMILGSSHLNSAMRK